MLDTVMEVRDETGHLVTEGEGHLFIGMTQIFKTRVTGIMKALKCSLK